MRTGNYPREILLKILEIIGFEDDKEAFVDEFLKNIQLQAVADLIQTLPTERQTEIKDQLAKNSNNPAGIASILNQHFTQTQVGEALQLAAKKAMTGYLEAIKPTLSPAQKEGLVDLFREFQPAPSSA
jgi:ABC-type transporter MlaC component